MEEFDEDHELANLTLALRNAGHINVEEVTRVYEIEMREGDSLRKTTWLEYLHTDGTHHTDPLDLSLVAVYVDATALRDEQDVALAESQGLTIPPV